MFISFILPVLNVENYLIECVSGLLGVENSEIILSIGNSVDKSNEICYELEQKHENVKVVLRNSTGLSNGRNCGFDVACGKYIAFIDSDDYISRENLLKTLQKLENIDDIDVLVSNYYLVSKKTKNIAQIKENIDFHDNSYTEKFLKSKGFYFSVWRNIYNRDFLIEHNFKFIEGIICEDVPYTSRIFADTTDIYYNSLPYYFYRRHRDGSLMNTFSIKRITDTIEVFKISIETLQKSPYTYNKHFISKILTSFFFTISEIYFDDKFQIDCYNVIKSNLHLLKCSKKHKYLYFGIKCFGLKNTAYMLYKIKKIKNTF